MKARMLTMAEINQQGPLTKKFLSHELENGSSLQAVLKLSDEQLGQFYSYAIELFNERKFADAADVFLVLTQLNPCLHNQWLSLGMCEQQKGDLPAAQSAYETAIILNPNDPRPYINAALCCLGLADSQTALYFIALMEELIPNCATDSDPTVLAILQQVKDAIRQSFQKEA